MRTVNFKRKILLYLKTNPKLSFEKLGVLLLADSIYNYSPDGLDEFKNYYAHFDPKIIKNGAEGVYFINIAKKKLSPAKTKEALNSYINIKYNYFGHYKTYNQNMKRFRNDCEAISAFIEDTLKKGKFPREVVGFLKESNEVRNTKDFYQLLQLYKKTKDSRIKFEILRRVGLIVLLARINRRYIAEDIEFATKQVKKVFHAGLGLKKISSYSYYLWTNPNGKIVYYKNISQAKLLYKKDAATRERIAMQVFPMQTFKCTNYKTKFNNRLIHIEERNKLKIGNKPYYGSILEKMLRKNLEFPGQVHDILGLKIVVEKEDQILPIIKDLESFLGGISTRNQVKDALHKFGRQQVNKYSSRDYYVWKAVYDIALPHPSALQIKKMLELTKNNISAQKMLKSRIEYFRNRPKDFVVELQLQDVNSYLLNMAWGSLAEHGLLKMNQIRSNSFYKLFQQEIYEKELIRFRNDILSHKPTSKKT